MTLVQWEPDDTLVIEVQAAADHLGFSFHDAVSLLVGIGLAEAIELGVLPGRATVPMDRGELLTRILAKLQERE